jgi:pimeloyl-ACP methyl ester carboxylesterase
MKIVLVHGWGFSATFWEPVRRGLGRESVALDLGFLAPPMLEIPSGAPVLAVGHSLGLLWLLARAHLPEGSRIVGINGFIRFTRASDFPSGVPPRVVERMRAGLLSGPDDVLRRFWLGCGLPEKDFPSSRPRIAALEAGLTLLRDGCPSGTGPVAGLLASRDDEIVTPGMTEDACAPERIRWVGKGGHLLPRTEPRLCADFIRDMADAA